MSTTDPRTPISPALLLSLFEAVHGRKGRMWADTSPTAYCLKDDLKSLSVRIRPGMRVEAKEHERGGLKQTDWPVPIPVFDASRILHGLNLPAPPSDWLSRVDVEWGRGLLALALPDCSPLLKYKDAWVVEGPEEVGRVRRAVRWRTLTCGDCGLLNVEVSMDGTRIRAYHGSLETEGHHGNCLPCGLMASWLSNTRHLPIVNPSTPPTT